jgi:hypothetical protein
LYAPVQEHAALTCVNLFTDTVVVVRLLLIQCLEWAHVLLVIAYYVQASRFQNACEMWSFEQRVLTCVPLQSMHYEKSH